MPGLAIHIVTCLCELKQGIQGILASSPPTLSSPPLSALHTHTHSHVYTHTRKHTHTHPTYAYICMNIHRKTEGGVRTAVRIALAVFPMQHTLVCG